LSAHGISKTYGSAAVLQDVDFDLAPGEIRALIGENGAGKSTFVKILGGAVSPSSGRVTLDGTELSFGSPSRARHRGLSVVYQEFTLVPDLSVADNLFLGREVSSGLLRRQHMQQEATRILSQLRADVEPTEHVRKLNVAHQQLVEIARALLDDARVLILDEPTATLTPLEIDRLFEVLRSLSVRGVSIIYVTHRLGEIQMLAESATVLRDGQHVGTVPVRSCSRADLVRMMVGRDLAEEYPARTSRPGPPVLEVAGLSARSRFRDISLTVRRGEVVGLAGLVGSGRTSVGLSIAGALPGRGEIVLNGERVQFSSPFRALEAGVAYVTEDRKRFGMFALLGIDENIAITHLASFTRAGWLRAGWRRHAADAARRVDVRAADLRRPVSTLSGGNQQKALLARFLLKPPDVLILDEPTRGVDVGARAEIYRLINDLAGAGLGILMISSDLEEVLGMSDRILVMREGRVSGEISRAQATAERVMALATDAA
jgi:ABC-type sugar transport system ATPase subunit